MAAAESDFSFSELLYVSFLFTPDIVDSNLQWSARNPGRQNPKHVLPLPQNMTTASRPTEVVFPRAECRSCEPELGSREAEGSHEKWMYETYGQDGAWINDEGMNPGPSSRRLHPEKIHQARLEFPPIKRRKVGQFSKLIPSQFKMWSLCFPGGLQGLPYSQGESTQFYYILSSQCFDVTM